jgi:hypothetical protein
VAKVFYGFTKEGRPVVVGDQENFPVKRGSPWILFATVLSIAAVVIAGVIVFGPPAVAGK